MKQIKLITTPITNSQAPADFALNYRNEFLRLVEIAAEGLTVSQMAVAIKVASKLQSTPIGNLYLEDTEWEYLRGKLSAAKWNFIAPEIVAMVEAVEKAETCEAPHLKAVAD